MGMAASQARYLALTARKSNCEYEGQQINQARTALANQSAEYFNQMLAMDVPTAPSSDDYTTVQYSYNDGYDDIVLENWYKLTTANSDYNYVVDTYYYADVYTGSQKKLTNPQVLGKEEVVSTSEEVSSIVQNDDGSYTINGNTTYYQLADYSENEDLQNALKDLESEGYLTFTNGEIDYTDLYGYEDDDGVWHITTKDDLEAAASETEELNDGYVDLTSLNVDLTDTTDWTDDDYTSVIAALEEAGLEGITKEDIVQAVADGYFETGYASYVSETDDDGETTYSFESATEDEAYTATSTGSLTEYTTTYTPTYVGNCALTELTDSLDLSDETALLQILADNPDSSIADYITRNSDGTYEYCGSGIYTYTYNGVTCYTTYEDLMASLTTYDEYGSPIEDQDDLVYYTATYINTKISDTSYALLETDSSGRYTSIKLDDDSTVYTLSCETVTDEDAYEDAMNQYYYDVQVYEKTIADINAKTEIIQQEDRTLELRLEQLDTEQNALQTEMEAVKKVISKNIETTFKTFSGS